MGLSHLGKKLNSEDILINRKYYVTSWVDLYYKKNYYIIRRS